jgi:hypothetical protein
LFSRAVGTKEREDLPVPDLEGNIVNRRKVAEALDEVLYLNHPFPFPVRFLVLNQAILPMHIPAVEPLNQTGHVHQACLSNAAASGLAIYCDDSKDEDGLIRFTCYEVLSSVSARGLN